MVVTDLEYEIFPRELKQFKIIEHGITFTFDILIMVI